MYLKFIDAAVKFLTARRGAEEVFEMQNVREIELRGLIHVDRLQFRTECLTSSNRVEIWLSVG
jgi:hypothetical protein